MHIICVSFRERVADQSFPRKYKHCNDTVPENGRNGVSRALHSLYPIVVRSLLMWVSWTRSRSFISAWINPWIFGKLKRPAFQFHFDHLFCLAIYFLKNMIRNFWLLIEKCLCKFYKCTRWEVNCHFLHSYCNTWPRILPWDTLILESPVFRNMIYDLLYSRFKMFDKRIFSNFFMLLCNWIERFK